MTRTPQPTTLEVLRRLQGGLLLVGLAGAATELLLIGHHEDLWQRIPLVTIGLGALAGIVLAAASRVSPPALGLVRLFRAAMVLLILSGVAGVVLHYRANMAFKLEMDPSMSGFALFSSVVRAKAPPALAPASLVLLGLLGLVSVFRRGDDPPPDPR